MVLLKIDQTTLATVIVKVILMGVNVQFEVFLVGYGRNILALCNILETEGHPV